MFWGSVIKEGKPFKTQSALEDSEFPALHISNVALSRNTSSNAKVYLLASFGKDVKDLVVACL